MTQLQSRWLWRFRSFLREGSEVTTLVSQSQLTPVTNTRNHPQHQHLSPQNHPLLSLDKEMRLFLHEWTVVSQFSASMLSHVEINSPAAPPPACFLVSVRVRGQVLSHGPHNSPNDWQVDTRAELWLWLPMRRLGGPRCANKDTQQWFCSRGQKKENKYTSEFFTFNISSGFLLQVFTITFLTGKGL